MSEPRRAFFLTGSTRGGRTTPQSVAEYLAQKLAERGVQSEVMWVRDALRSDQGIAAMLAAIERTGVFALVFPLCISSLPAITTRALEVIADCRREDGARKPFIPICQGGYPEARQSEAALGVCQQFAAEASFAWAGGLAFGVGAMIGCQSLEKMGLFTKHVRQVLHMTAEAIACGQPVLDEAVRVMAKLLCRPGWSCPCSTE